MIKFSGHLWSHVRYRQWIGMVILALILALSGQVFRQPPLASADGGSFPTRTPTLTPRPAATSTPTTTATSIPIVTGTAIITLVTDGEQQVLNPSNTTVEVQTSTSDSNGISGCWSFGILILLVLIVAIAYWFTRQTRSQQND